MTTGRFLVGVMLACVALVPIGMGAGRLCRRYMPSWVGLKAWLSAFVVALAIVELETQILGAFGWFRLAPVVTTLALSGTVLWWVFRDAKVTAGEVGHRRSDLSQLDRQERIVVGVLISIAIGSWASRIAGVLARGMMSYDTLWYHLPAAVRFVQTGNVMPIHFTSLDADMAFFPFNSEMLHALGMLFFGSDIASTLLNLGWFGIALVAGAVIGSRYRLSHLTALGVAVIFATPTFVVSGAGTAYTDPMSLALFLCALAFFVSRDETAGPHAQTFLVALASGLAIGTKFTMLGPIALLVVIVLIVERRESRGRHLIALAAGLGGGGGFWYIRNLVVFASPLPSLDATLGFLSLPTIKGMPQATFASRMANAGYWQHYFIPGFEQMIGMLWPLVVASPFVAAAWCMRRDVGPRIRTLGLLSIGSLMVYIVSPQVIALRQAPVYFSVNIRYMATALVTGILCLIILLRTQRRFVLAFLVVIGVTSQLSYNTWHVNGVGEHIVELNDPVRVLPGLAIALLGSLGVTVFFVGTARPWRIHRQTRLASLVVVIVGMTLVRGSYLSNRYERIPYFPGLFTWAQGQHDQRIVIEPVSYIDNTLGRKDDPSYVQRNILRLQYPLAGRDLSNWNQMAIFRRGDRIEGPRSCDEWVTYLTDERATRVVLWGPPDSTPTSTALGRWTAQQPDSQLILTSPLLTYDSDSITSSKVYVYKVRPSGNARC